jgi:hypothetical protein
MIASSSTVALRMPALARLSCVRHGCPAILHITIIVTATFEGTCLNLVIQSVAFTGISALCLGSDCEEY